MIIIGVHKKGEFSENYEKAYFDVGFLASYDQASNNKALAESEQPIEQQSQMIGGHD